MRNVCLAILPMLGATAAAFAQAPAGSGNAASAPPLQPGLWEQRHSQTLNGVDIGVPAFVVAEARRRGVRISDDGRSEQICLTAQNMASIGLPSTTNLPACRKENVRLGDAGLSFDLVCADSTGSGRGSVNVAFDSFIAYHGNFTFTGTHRLFGNNMLPLTVAGPVSGKWVAASCSQ